MMFRDKHIDTIQINPNKEGVFSLVSYTCDLAKKSGWTDIKINKLSWTLLSLTHMTTC